MKPRFLLLLSLLLSSPLFAQSLPPQWAAQNVGAVGLAGSSAYDTATDSFTLQGAGLSVGGTADAFHFLSQSLSGDFQITARVSGPSGTNAAARAGLMVRQSAAAGSAHAMVALSPGGAASFQYRPASSAASYSQPMGTGGAAQWLRLVRSGSYLVGYRSEDGSSWVRTSAEKVVFAGPVLAGLLVNSGSTTVREGAVFEQVSVVAPGALVLGAGPLSWKQEAIGAVTAVPDSRYDAASGTWYLAGAGSDIGGLADSFTFLHRTWHGDGTFVVRVADVPNASALSKLGLMVREGLSTGARHVTLVMPRAGKTAELLVRRTAGTSSVSAGLSQTGLPGWIKLERVGDRFTAYASADGIFWTQFAQIIQPLSSAVEFGLALSNGSGTRASTAVVGNLSLTAIDENGNGLPDAWEMAMFGNLLHLGQEDADGDGLSNAQEFLYGFNPNNAFSNGGPLNDGALAAQSGVAPVGVSLARLQREGFLEWNAWLGIPGRLVRDLTGSGAFAGRPAVRSFVGKAAAPSNYSDNFGHRLRGTITAPVSGEYTFWVAGDDTAQLWLGTGASRFSKRPVAFLSSAVATANWDAQPLQKSAPVTLVAGQSYWIEVLAKDATGLDHAEIAWQPPGQARQMIDPSALRAPEADPADLNDDNLPDVWAAGFGVSGEYADPDQDGLSNFDEYRYGSDPTVPAGVPGYLSRDFWKGPEGQRVRDLTESSDFLNPPDLSELFAGANAPSASRYDSFGERYRGTIQVPVSGAYTFWIAGDDNCELWLSGDGRKFQKRRIAFLRGLISEGLVGYGDFDRFGSQKSAPVQLLAGRKYYFEILHKEATLNEHVEVAWLPPGGVRELLPASVLASFVKEGNDLDDDDLPDDWERSYGLNPADNGLVDPLQASYADFDGDGLSNREEYLRGTNPTVADSDGDSLSDGDEALVYGSDPTRPDISAFDLVRKVDATAATATTGQWLENPENGSMYIRSVRGSLEFSVNAPEAGAYAVQAAIRVPGASWPFCCRLKVLVDGVLAGRVDTPVEAYDKKNVAVLLPWLAAGPHTVRVVFDNARRGQTIFIDSISLLKATGADADGNGQPDWLGQLLDSRNGINPMPPTSLTSPVCLEGRGQWQAVSATAGFGDVALNPAPNGGWYANVALPPDGSPQTVNVSFENGARQAGQTVSWAPTNLAAIEEAIVIRAGDAMRLTAHAGPQPDGSTVTLHLNGALLGSFPADAPLVHTFPNAGVYLIKALYNSLDGFPVERNVEVTVRKAAFAGNPLAMVNQTREWNNPALGTQIAVEFDKDVPSTIAPLAPAGTKLRFSVPDLLPHCVVARLSPGGPILAHANIRAQQLFSANDTAIETVETYADGSRLVAMNVVVSDLQPDAVVKIAIHAGGVVFQDTGTSTKVLTASDFDALGMVTVYFLQSASSTTSVCHTISVYDGSTVVGGNDRQ